MLFNSLHFAIFFITISFSYYILPQKHRWKLLLIGSCYFYMVFKPIYILILGFTIVVDYYAGIYIENAVGKKRKIYLICSLIANIGVLSFFKYYNFVNVNLSLLLGIYDVKNSLPMLTMLLPIGLSFHTFQAMSYTIEVFRGNQKAEKRFGIYSIYVMFYPQLVAGPIERPQNIIYQFDEKHDINYERIANGLKIMIWGLFKKVVIADRLATIVNFVYDNPTKYEGFPLVIATILFAFQIYCDFSGYSDIAIGSAQVIGFRLMKNFDRPYFSQSISEFWKRWHISLSSWFKDYVYIPLGGNRVKRFHWYSNLLLTFTLSGLWHGANWTYVAWGSMNGIYLILETSTLSSRQRFASYARLNRVPFVIGTLKVFITFSLICLSWIFFRSNTIQDAFYIFTHLFSNMGSSIETVTTTNLGSTKYEILISILSLILLFKVESIQGRESVLRWISTKPIHQRLILYLAMILIILMFGVFNLQQQFIYFQF